MKRKDFLHEFEKILEEKIHKLLLEVRAEIKDTGKDMKLFSQKLDVMYYKINAVFFDTMKIIMHRQAELEKKIEILEKKLNASLLN